MSPKSAQRFWGKVLGSHGMQAFRYEAMMAMLETGKLAPEKLVGQRVSLDQAPGVLMAMDREGQGLTVVDRF